MPGERPPTGSDDELPGSRSDVSTSPTAMEEAFKRAGIQRQQVPAASAAKVEPKAEAVSVNRERSFDAGSLLAEAVEAIAIADSVPIPPRGSKVGVSPAEEAARTIKLKRMNLGEVLQNLKTLPADTAPEVRASVEASAEALLNEIRAARTVIQETPPERLQLPPEESLQQNPDIVSGSSVRDTQRRNSSKFTDLNGNQIFAPRPEDRPKLSKLPGAAPVIEDVSSPIDPAAQKEKAEKSRNKLRALIRGWMPSLNRAPASTPEETPVVEETQTKPSSAELFKKFTKLSTHLTERSLSFGKNVGLKVGEVVVSGINQAGEFYDRQPLWRKIALTGVLLAGTAVSMPLSASLAWWLGAGLGVQRGLAGLAMYTKFRKFGLDAEKIYKDETRWGITRNAALMFAGTGETEKQVLAATLAGLYGGLGVGVASEAAAGLSKVEWSDAVANWLKETWSGLGTQAPASVSADMADHTPPITIEPKPVEPLAPITPQSDQFYTAPDQALTPKESVPITPQSDQFYTDPEMPAAPELAQTAEVVTSPASPAAVPEAPAPTPDVASSQGSPIEIPAQAPQISAGVTSKGFEWTLKNSALEQLKSNYPDTAALIAANPNFEGSDMHKLLLASSSPKELETLVREISSRTQTPSGELVFNSKLDKSAILKTGTTISFDENGKLKLEPPVKAAPAVSPAPSSGGSSVPEIETKVDARTSGVLGAAPFDTSGFKPEYFASPETQAQTPAAASTISAQELPPLEEPTSIKQIPELKPPNVETPPQDQGILRREAQNGAFTEPWKLPDANTSANPYAEDIESFQQTMEGPSSPELQSAVTPQPESTSAQPEATATSQSVVEGAEYKVNSSGLQVDVAHANVYTDATGLKIIFGGTVEERVAKAAAYLAKNPTAEVFYDSTKSTWNPFAKYEITRAFIDQNTGKLQQPNGSMDPTLQRFTRLPSIDDLKQKLD